MATMWALLLATTILVSTAQLSYAREVSNEDIRDAILSLLHMVRATEDKLERHELRERALGEQLKKMVGNVDKRQRLLDPVRGTITRLDERLASVETILMQRDERERIQLQKTADAIGDIQAALPSFMETITEIIREEKAFTKPESKPVNAVTKDDLQSTQKELVGRAEKMSDVLSKIESQLKDVKETTKKTKNFNDKSVESVEKLEEQLKSSEQLLEKYENKLAELNNRIVPTPSISKDKPEWQTNFLQALETQRTNLEQVLSDVKTISDKLNKLPDSVELQNIKNETLDHLEKLRYESGSRNDKTFIKIEAQLKELHEDYKKKHEDLSKAVSEVGELTEMSHGDVAKSYEQLRTEVQSLGKVEKVMLQTADNILDTKRRVEYGVHQILLEVGDLVKLQSKDLNSTMNDRFDSIELSILESQTGALANLTTKLESEMSQVWRQIGIMYQQLSASTTALDRLQVQTDAYVNGSMSTMDSMEGKVSKITGRMVEVDENLNFLLGRLSLVTQEFNNIKTGLGAALDNIRSSFLEVQDKLKDAGPGPHQIPKDVHVERK